MWALGYTFAEDRLYQLEYLLRSARGQMAEIGGPSFAASDYAARGLRFAHLGAKLWESQPSAGLARRFLPAFVSGINAYISDIRAHPDRWPSEFRRLHIAPSPVEPEELLSLAYLYGALLTRDAIQARLSRVLLTLKITPSGSASDNLDSLREPILNYPTLDQDNPPEIVPGVPLERWLQDPESCRIVIQNYLTGASDQARRRTHRAPSSVSEGIGSNNWAVAPARSSEGAALFASDPHLELTDPPIFYEVTLSCPEVRFAGALLAGLPFAAVGFNGFVAWGSTNLGVDYSEFILEPVSEKQPRNWTRSGFVRVRVAPGLRAPLFLKPVIHSPRGWVIRRIPSPVSPATSSDGFVSKNASQRRVPHHLTLFWWGSLSTDFSLDFVYQMLTAHNISEFRESLRHFSLPPQNFVFADVHGNIAFQAAGRIPARSPETSRTLWTASEFDALPKRFIPFDDLPRWDSLQNARGFVATANNPPAGSASPFALPGIFGEGYRIARIVSFIRTKPRLSAEDMIALQSDHFSLRARLFLPLLLKCLPEGASSRCAQALRGWDGDARADSFPPLVFRLWMDEIAEARRDAGLPLDDSSLFYALIQGTAEETERVRNAFSRTVRAIERIARVTDNSAAPRWGDFHRVLRRHSLSHFFKAYRASSFAHGGDEGTVDPGRSARQWHRRGIPLWIQTHGAAYRFVAVLGSPPRLYSCMPGSSASREHLPEADRLRWQEYLQHRYRLLPFP